MELLERSAQKELARMQMISSPQGRVEESLNFLLFWFENLKIDSWSCFLVTFNLTLSTQHYQTKALELPIKCIYIYQSYSCAHWCSYK